MLNESLSSLDGEDYIGLTETVTFYPGQNTSSVEVVLTDDAVYEGLQEFSVTLTSANSDVVNIINGNATVTIVDDDGKFVNCGMVPMQ